MLCLPVYLRATFDERIGLGPVTFFLDIIELSSTTAEGTETALLDCLARHGLPVDYLRNHWVGLGTDGASVMTGCKSGLHFLHFFHPYPYYRCYCVVIKYAVLNIASTFMTLRRVALSLHYFLFFSLSCCFETQIYITLTDSLTIRY